MKPNIKSNVFIIIINSLVMICLFLVKFVFLPKVPNINLSIGSDLYFLLTWVPIPLISIIGISLERHIRFWIIPDFIYCALSFAVSSEDCPYGIGVSGFFTASYYSRQAALIDRLLTFVIIVLVQLVIKFLINLINRKKNNSL